MDMVISANCIPSPRRSISRGFGHRGVRARFRPIAEGHPDEDVVDSHRVVSRVGDGARACSPVLGFELYVRLHLMGGGVGAVALEPNGLGRPIDAVVTVLARNGKPRR